MSMKSALVACILVLSSFSILVGANGGKVGADPVTPKKLHDQELCPIMGKKINKKFYADIQGQRVYFCCPKCDEKFKADADSYFKKAAADGVQFENIQKICPVTGEPISKKASEDWEGRRVYFCCKMCQPVFAKDPLKYLKRLDMPADSVKWDKDVM